MNDKTSCTLGLPDQKPDFKRPKQVADHLQIAVSTLWAWAASRRGFPRPIKAGPRVTLFDMNAINTFLREQQ